MHTFLHQAVKIHKKFSMQYIEEKSHTKNDNFKYSHPVSLSLWIADDIIRTQPRKPAPCFLCIFLWFHILMVIESFCPIYLQGKVYLKLVTSTTMEISLFIYIDGFQGFQIIISKLLESLYKAWKRKYIYELTDGQWGEWMISGRVKHHFCMPNTQENKCRNKVMDIR